MNLLKEVKKIEKKIKAIKIYRVKLDKDLIKNQVIPSIPFI